MTTDPGPGVKIQPPQRGQFSTAVDNSRYEGGPAHPSTLLECLEAFVAAESVGTRRDPANETHLQGLVAEHIWHLLTLELAIPVGELLRVDGPDWSPLDRGGDGLAVYRVDGALCFRLWESKAHTGSGSVRDVVNGAARQMESNALRYLARFSKVGQSLGEEEMRSFYGRLVEMWQRRAREAGGGIAVSTASTEVEAVFGNFSSYWNFANGDQRLGLVVRITKFAAFAELVQEHVWKGL